MRFRICLSLLAAATAAGPARPTWAGAWAQEPGQGIAILGPTFYRSDYYSKFDLDLYLEHGLSRRFTLGLDTGVYSLNDKSSATAVKTPITPSYEEVFGRVILGKWDTSSLALQPMVGNLKQDFYGERTVAHRQLREAELRIAYGKSFDPGRGHHLFLDLEVGYRYICAAGARQVRADLTAGWSFKPDWLMLIQTNQSYYTGNDPANVFNYQAISVGTSMVIPLSRTWSIQGGLGHTLRGTGISPATSILFSLWYRWGRTPEETRKTKPSPKAWNMQGQSWKR